MAPLIILLVAPLLGQVADSPFTIKQLVGDDVVKQVRDPLGELEIPTLRGEGATLAQGIIAEGITKEFRFETKAKDVAVVIISTKIRADLPKDSTVLNRTRDRYQKLSPQMGKDDAGQDILSAQFIGPAEEPVFESVLRHAIYVEAFPYALPTQKRASTNVAVSQFFVLSGRYIECAVFLRPKEEETEEDLIARAKKLCTSMRVRILVVK